ncbi:MAG: hypothetical protein KDI74_16130 [Gammaproteobacteria bacterium]|nr:hypothetical protein [Gammaproteobacteria bacterium]
MSDVHDFEPEPDLKEFIQERDEALGFRVAFILDDTRWKSFKPPNKLSWRKYKFTENNKKNIPESKGIYAFVFQSNITNLPTHGYIMYIGIVTKSERTLNQRYGEYLREQKKLKRPKVSTMLAKFAGGLQFFFAVADPQEVDLEQLEIDIASAVIPPAVTKDFTPRVRQIVNALAFV